MKDYQFVVLFMLSLVSLHFYCDQQKEHSSQMKEFISIMRKINQVQNKEIKNGLVTSSSGSRFEHSPIPLG